MLAQMWRSLKRLHADEQGAEGLEKLLIIAAVVLPLLGLLIWMRKEIKVWVADMWDKMKGKSSADEADYFSDTLPGGSGG
jgi:Flp pilus assembly pilin Flp